VEATETVNAVAGKLVGTDTALGVLLMGTLNHFAKDVGIPQNLEAAVRNFFTGHVVNVDVGEVNGRAAFGSYRKPKKIAGVARSRYPRDISFISA
jgi:diacylglycerol kinase family enzyme